MFSLVLEALVRASLHGGAYALVVWALCALLPRLPGGLRAMLWWLVSLKFLVALAGPAPLALPLLPAVQPTGGVQVLRAAALPEAPDGAPAPPDTLDRAAVAAWGLSVALSAWVLMGGLRRARCLRRTALPASRQAEETFRRLRRLLGVRSSVALAFSPEIASPQVLGPWRPLVLIPELEDSELEMALAHELLHVKRGDLWLSLVPELARLLLPFHPLTRLAAREERLAREVACDAATLRALGRAPREYGALLLRFGVIPSLPGAAAGAPTFRSLRRRLQMLDQIDRPRVRPLHVALVLLGLLALVPFAAVARDGAPPQPEPMAVAQVNAVRHADTTSDVLVDVGEPEDDAVDAEEAFIVREGDSTTMFLSTDADGRAYEALDRKQEGDFFYFRHGARQWVTRDPAVLAEVSRILEPMRELGGRQGELGGRQGELGGEQGLLGEKQGELGRRLSLLAGSRGNDLEVEKLHEEMDALGAEMDALGGRMDLLGREMDVLGKEMDAASERARGELRRVAEDAVRRGVAQPLAW